MQHAIIKHNGETFVGVIFDLQFFCFTKGSTEELLHIKELNTLLIEGEVENISKTAFRKLYNEHTASLG